MTDMTDFFPFLYGYMGLMAFVFGCCVGSFLNVCVYRIPREESVVAPRSHCPHCGKMIAWYDNIPLLSYLVLRARCRHCGDRISIRYFLIEGLVGVLFLLVWLRHGVDPRTPVYWMMVSGLVLGTFVDIEHMIIPDRVTLGGIVAGLVLSPLIPSLHHAETWWGGLRAALVGAATGAGLLWVVAVAGKWVFKKDAMGFGDVKLLGGVGALLGWEAVLFTVMVSATVGALVGGILVLSRRKEWQSRVPYGPYLAAAAVVWILGGSGWWQAYVEWSFGGLL